MEITKIIALALAIITASSCKESKKNDLKKRFKSHYNKQNIKKNEYIICINIL
jgi:hypothetical protein